MPQLDYLNNTNSFSKEKDKEKVLLELVSATAKEELALGEIISAEADKLKFTLCTLKELHKPECNIEKILEVNESVLEVLKEVEDIEKNLKEILEEACECLEDDEEKKYRKD